MKKFAKLFAILLNILLLTQSMGVAKSMLQLLFERRKY